jgi:AraC-like DNA-binding protein
LKSDTQFNYFIVNDWSIMTGFYVTGVGLERVAAHEPYPIPIHPEMYNFSWNLGRVLPEYQFVFIFDGEGEFESHATGSVKVAKGSAFFLLPDVWHRYRPSSNVGWRCYWISFNGSIPHLWQQTGVMTPSRAVQRLTRPESIKRVLSKVHLSAIKPSSTIAASASFAALGIIADILAEIPLSHEAAMEENRPRVLRTEDSLLSGALGIIWNHSHRNLSADMIAQELGVSRRTLERHFTQFHHRGVLQEITACRISRAKLMLTSTHLPIKNIARAAGFSSPTHLATTFRRELNMTPKQIRANSRP